MHSVTQRHVAAAAGVSQAVVSLVLSGGGDRLPSLTRQRVQAAADALGYVPNRSAQRLRAKCTWTIACVLPDICNPYYPALERGVQEVAAAAGYDVIAVHTDGTPAQERRLLDWGRERRVDGLVGVFFTLSGLELGALAEHGVAVLRVEARRKSDTVLPLDNIYVDNRRAAKEAVEHLIRRGHRRIAMLSVNGGPGPERVAGYAAAMAEANLPAQLEVQASFTPEAGSAGMLSLLAGAVQPTAVFAANDLMALGAMMTLRDHGLQVPGDVAVMGFDDIEAARWVTPALTTVNQFQRTLGRASAEMLLQRLAGLPPGTAGRQREMPFQLMMRESA